MDLYRYSSGQYRPKKAQPTYHLYFASPSTGHGFPQIFLASTWHSAREGTIRLEEETVNKSHFFIKGHDDWVISKLEELRWLNIDNPPELLTTHEEVIIDRAPSKAQWFKTTVSDVYLADIEKYLKQLSPPEKSSSGNPMLLKIIVGLIGLLLIFGWLKH